MHGHSVSRFYHTEMNIAGSLITAKVNTANISLNSRENNEKLQP
jgi:hypothetical protein